jgi:hypothetical protein
MKQYLNSEQTSKLIKLGFEKPKSISGYCQRGPYEYDAGTNTKMAVYDDTQYPIYAYSIGELIEMLPKSLKNSYNPPLIIECNEKWRVYYGVQEDYSGEWSIWLEEERKELIDAIYDMIVKLKEEGVI